MSWENKNLRCRDCKFWWPTAEGAGGEPSRERSLLGQCRRHAPSAMIFDVPDHAHQRGLHGLARRVLVPGGDHQEVARQAMEVGVIERAVSRFVAHGHPARQRGDVQRRGGTLLRPRGGNRCWML